MEDKALKIINHFGVKHQLKKLSEEIYELQEAILNNDKKKHIIEEMADVKVLLLQLQKQYDITDKQLEKQMNYKISRTCKRYNLNEKETVIIDEKGIRLVVNKKGKEKELIQIGKGPDKRFGMFFFKEEENGNKNK